MGEVASACTVAVAPEAAAMRRGGSSRWLTTISAAPSCVQYGGDQAADGARSGDQDPLAPDVARAVHGVQGDWQWLTQHLTCQGELGRQGRICDAGTVTI